MFYQHGLPQPYHVSVGAVVFDDDFNICTHHFYRDRMPERLHFLSGGLPEVYHLMRESLEDNESLETCVLRGIEEELGVCGELKKYLGSVTAAVITPKFEFQKTTLYHAVKLTSLGKRTGDDEESKSDLEWYSLPDLYRLYQAQARQTDRPELDETEVLRRFAHAYGRAL